MTTQLSMILNTFYSGPQAWFFLAADHGYFAEAGLDVTFIEGDTLANAVPKVASGAFDIGYGDMNALIELAGRDPARAPIAVFAMHNWSPYTIAVAADGPIATPRDLQDQLLLSHANDAALRMFPEFARRAGLDRDRVRLQIAPDHHRVLIAQILSGASPAAGLFGFVNTLNSAALEAGIDPARLRHFEWRKVVPELYGAAIIASRDLVRNNPRALTGFVAAVNRGLKDAIAYPDAAIAAVARRNPTIDTAANRARLVGTLAVEMSHPEQAIYGLGDIDDARLSTAIALICDVKQLPLRPALADLFDRSFLPPTEARVRTLAK